MPLYKLRYFAFALRLTVAKIYPDGYGQRKLCRRNFGVFFNQPAALYEKLYKPREIVRNVCLVLICLQFLKLGIPELLNSKHLARFAYVRVVQNIANIF